MKKFFTLFVALMATLAINATQEDLSLYSFTWGYGSTAEVIDGKLNVNYTGDWSAAATGFSPVKDLTGWDYICVEVEAMTNCNENFLKIFLDDYRESSSIQIENAYSNIDLSEGKTVIKLDLSQTTNGWDRTQARYLGIMAQNAGAQVVISRVYLENNASEKTEQDLDLGAFTWGYGSISTVVDGKLNVELTGDWSATATGFSPCKDLTEWDYITVEVEAMTNCTDNFLKIFLDDSRASSEIQIDSEFSDIDLSEGKATLRLDLSQTTNGWDRTQARYLGIMAKNAGAQFTISRVYLEKKGSATNNVVAQKAKENKKCYNILGMPVNANYKGIVIVNGKKLSNK
ncbi:MAG: hypothetical protein KBT34_03465 [Prevotella sp.]|nr:hypothetical protein [Candidatus Prevotella equi]